MLAQRAGVPAFKDIVSACERLAGITIETPCVPSAPLGAATGCDLWLKLENLQRTGSFKARGSYVKLSALSHAARAKGAVAASAGNHAQGVAYHAKRLGIDTVIVMPKTTPYTKVRRTEAYGARVVLAGATLSEAAAHANALAAEQQRTLVHPYDDPEIIAGQGSVAVEMLRSVPDLDVLLVPVGGGGLISGIGIAAKHLRPAIKVIGVQIERGEAPTLAEGIAVKQVGELNAEIISRFVDDMVHVDEASLERAVHLLLDEEKIMVEGAGAAGLSAILRYGERFAGKRAGLVVSGGNIDTGLLASVILRARFQEGRVVRFRVQIVDAPGALAQISNLLAHHHANVVEVAHHRAFSGVPAKCAELDFTIEMRRPTDIATILPALRDMAFETTLLSGSTVDDN